MKFFIVAALLVAAVAGQSLDMTKLNKDITGVNSLFKFDRSAYPMVRDMNTIDNQIYGDYDFNYHYDTDVNTYTVLSLHEMMAHPLFREYMGLPLFRQYWQYPAFQRYVCSIFFQRFWQVPVFQQYFMSPALFYKYIYPIVNLFKYDATSMNTFPYNTYNTGYDYHYGQQTDLIHKMPTVCVYNSVYCKVVVEKMYNHLQMMMMKYGHQEMPYYTNTNQMYNPYVARMIQGYYNYPTFDTERMMTPYTFNKERMFNTEKVYRPINMDINTFETPKMTMDDTVNNMMGVKTFDKKMIPETMIKA